MLPGGTHQVNLIRSSRRRSLISKDISSCVTEAVSVEALRRALINSALQGYAPNIGDTHRANIQRLHADIQSTARGRPILSFTGNGVLSQELCYFPVQHENAFGFQRQYSTSNLLESIRSEARLVKLALHSQSQSGVDYDQLLEVLYLKDDNDRLYLFADVDLGPVEAYHSVPAPGNLQEIVAGFVERSSEAKERVSLPLALFSRQIQRSGDPLMKFVSGWAALDSLAETIYNSETLSHTPEQVNERKEITRRLIEDLPESGRNSKFLKCFAYVTHVLFPTMSDEEKLAEIRSCHREYEMRNRLFHDGAGIDSPPSCNAIKTLLSKYLCASMEYFSSR